MQSLPFRACSFLVVTALVLSSCNIAPPPLENVENTETLSITAENKDALENNTAFKDVIKKLRASGKKVDISDARQFLAKEGDTKIILPYLSENNKREFVTAALRGKSVKNVVLGTISKKDGEVTMTTSNMTTGMVLKTVAVQNNQGATIIKHWEIGEQASTLTVEGLLTPANTTTGSTISTQADCTGYYAAYMLALTLQASAGFRALAECGVGFWWWSPLCWGALIELAATTLASWYAADALNHCH